MGMPVIKHDMITREATATDLLAANPSVKTAVDTIVQMESALKNKLSMFSNIICQTV